MSAHSLQSNADKMSTLYFLVGWHALGHTQSHQTRKGGDNNTAEAQSTEFGESMASKKKKFDAKRGSELTKKRGISFAKID